MEKVFEKLINDRLISFLIKYDVLTACEYQFVINKA